MEVHGFPIITHSLEDQSHSSGSRIRRSLVSLRLSPKTSHYRAIPAKHDHMLIADIEFGILDIRIGGFSILAHLRPALGNRAVVIKEIQAQGIPVTAGDQIDVDA